MSAAQNLARPRLVGILGPTASGKSAVALALAARIGGEIVSCDSMQVYRGLDIGTAKPTPAERAAMPHHLIDCLDIAEPWDLRRFLDAVDPIVRDILARGRWPILCGGSGLYARALFYGFDLRPTDATVRDAVRAQLDGGERDALIAELTAANGAVAALVAANDRYLVRAVEVLRLTGAAPLPDAGSRPPDYAGPQYVLLPDADTNRARITTRTHAMLDAGWIDEAQAWIARGLLATPTAAQALGYRDIADYLDGVIVDRSSLATILINRTAQYAKRQRTWFRNQHPGAVVLPVPPGRPASPERLAADLAAQLLRPA